MDPIAKITATSGNHLRLLLETNEILQDFTSSMIEDCTELVFQQVFANIPTLFDFIVQNANENQLKIIYSILKARKLNDIEEQQKQNKIVNDTKPQNIIAKNTCDFSTISIQSIENICNFLDRNDIKQFKSTSRSLAIIGLNIMQKYSVGICYAEDLIDANYKHHTIQFKDYMFWHRYNANTSFVKIFRDIERLCIPQKYQIPIEMYNNHYYDQIFEFSIISAVTKITLFDKRNIILFDGTKYRNMNETDTFDFNTNTIVEFHHFNVYNQEMEIIQYVIVNHHVTYQHIIKFITDYLIKHTNENKYTENMKFSLFQLFRNTNSERRDCEQIVNVNNLICEDTSRFSTIVSIVFQLNVDDAEELREEYESEHLIRFRHNVYEYVYSEEPTKDREIKINADVYTMKIQIRNYLIHKNEFETLTEDEINEEIDEILWELDCNFKDPLEIDISWNININTLKKHLSKTYLHEIPTENIQLRPINTERYYNYCEDIEEKIENNMRLKITPFYLYRDAEYEIYIYGPKEMPFPYHLPNSSHWLSRYECSAKIRIKYKNKFSVKELVNYLDEITSNPLFIGQYQKINHILQQIDQSSKMSYFTRKRGTNSKTFYSCDDEMVSAYSNSDYNYTQSIDLFFRDTDKIGSALVPLKIRFAFNKYFDTNTSFENAIRGGQFIGVPLYVWIKKTETMDDVINNYTLISHHKGDIVNVFKICCEEKKVIGISNCQFASYTLHTNIRTDDFLVIILSDYQYEEKNDDPKNAEWKMYLH
eukprot:417278_1